MEAITFEGTAKTPTVKFDAANGIFEIKGRSIPENSIEFYKPLVDWLDEYAKSPQDNTQDRAGIPEMHHAHVQCKPNQLEKNQEPVRSRKSKGTRRS